MSQLFGFLINKKGEPKGQSPIPPNSDDAVSTVAGGYFGTYVDVEGVSKNEYELIKRYRDMSLHPEVDTAIDEIINEFVVSDADDSPVEIELSNLDVGAGVKKKIRDEFDCILKMLNFDKGAHQIIRSWYVDGRTYYHKVVDLDNPKLGILELRYIDPLKIRKVRQKLSDPERQKNPHLLRGTALEYDWGQYVEYYIYKPRGFSGSMSMPQNSASDFSTAEGIKIAHDSIATANSGVTDLNKKYTLSFLHKAIKSLNQLRMIEDSLVIYRLSRAPERRIFYIDVGNLPKVKAEQYLRDVMARYRNKLVYDANTGEIRDDKKHMSMLEDFWLPRREGGRGTEITTLPGGQNLGELTDIKYFQTQLYKALNVPASRLESDKSFDLGKSEEINRDEIKFTKFVGRLRKKFSDLFHDLLKTQLILKGVITPDDWEEMKEHIQYDYLYDNHFSELKDLEMLQKKMEVLNELDLYVGKYFSQDYVMRQLLQFTEQEIVEMREQINSEIKLGLVMDPVAQLGQEQETAELDQEMQKAQIDQMKQPPLPPSNKNAK